MRAGGSAQCCPRPCSRSPSRHCTQAAFDVSSRETLLAVGLVHFPMRCDGEGVDVFEKTPSAHSCAAAPPTSILHGRFAEAPSPHCTSHPTTHPTHQYVDFPHVNVHSVRTAHAITADELQRVRLSRVHRERHHYLHFFRTTFGAWQMPSRSNRYFVHICRGLYYRPGTCGVQIAAFGMV